MFDEYLLTDSFITQGGENLIKEQVPSDKPHPYWRMRLSVLM